MNVTIGTHTFSYASYDADGDVLYLKKLVPDNAVDFEDTPEGHGLRFDADGQLVGLTLLSPRWLLENKGHLEVTLPQHVDVDHRALGRALVAA